MKPAQMKPSHMMLCAVLVVAGVALLATGVGGGAFLLLGCMAMMGAMMWMMMRPGRDDHGDR